MSTAFVLSGGASLGAIQVGMLQALLQLGVRPDLVVGTSVGAINGAWVASYPAAPEIDRLAAVWRRLRRSDVFPPNLWRAVTAVTGRGRAVVPSSGLRRLLSRHIPDQRLKDLPVPVHVVAVDVLTGQDVLLSAGSTVDAVLASASIPGIFPRRRSADAATWTAAPSTTRRSRTPSRSARTSSGCCRPGYSCALPHPPASALGMALHGLTLLIHQRLAADVARYRDQVDLRVAPLLCPPDVSPADFNRGRTPCAGYLLLAFTVLASRFS